MNPTPASVTSETAQSAKDTPNETARRSATKIEPPMMPGRQYLES